MTVRAGWYSDEKNPETARYWTGEEWSDETRFLVQERKVPVAFSNPKPERMLSDADADAIRKAIAKGGFSAVFRGILLAVFVLWAVRWIFLGLYAYVNGSH